MDNPFISIITASYNRDKFIGRAVHSILQQTYNNFELIIIDDGSTDGTSRIIESMRDHRLKFFQKPHSGCSDTKNQGILEAGGEFVLFIDSDDFISHDYLANGVNGIEANPEYDYYYPGKMMIVDESGGPTDRIWRYDSYKQGEVWKFFHSFLTSAACDIPLTGAFVKKEVYEKNGLFDTSLFNMEDADYLVRNIMNMRLKLLPGLISYFNRQHQGQNNKNRECRSRAVADLMHYVTENVPVTNYWPKMAKQTDSSTGKKMLYEWQKNLFMTQAKRFAPYSEPFWEYARACECATSDNPITKT